MNIAINYNAFSMDTSFKEVVKELTKKGFKIYLMVNENNFEFKEESDEEIKAQILESLSLDKNDVTDIFLYNQSNKNKILNIKNFGYIIENSIDCINDENRRYYSKARIGFITNSKSQKSISNFYEATNSNEILSDILRYNEEIINSLKDPITVKSGIPSIDKNWQSSYNAAQYFTELPSMPIWEYVYLNNYSNLDSLAIRYFGAKITFRELFERVDEYAKSLKKSGITSNDIVTICMPNTPEAVIAFLATNKIGATASMLHPLLKGEDILENLDKTKSRYLVMADMCYGEVSKIIDSTNVEKVVVVSPADSMPPIKSHPLGIKMLYIAQEKFKKIKTKMVIKRLNSAIKLIPEKCLSIIEPIRKEIERLENKIVKVSYEDKFIKWNDEVSFGSDYDGSIECDEPYVPYETKVLLRTGGTTGKSKLACISNENVIRNTAQLRDTIPFYKKGDELLAISPIFHGFGLVDSIITALAVNMSVDLHPQYNKSIFISSMLKNKPTLILGVPTLWKSVVSSKKLEKADLSFAKVWISGGDTLEPKLRDEINKFRTEHNVTSPIMSGIGSTEATAALAFTGVNSMYEKSVGFPLPLNDVKILDPDTLKEVPVGEIGVLYVGGPTVMNGYYNDSEETSKALVKLSGTTYLNTGDVCYMTENGEICFEDRNSNIIIVSGVNVYSSEIEAVIKEIPEVVDCAVVKMPHEYKMNVPVAFVTLKNNAELTAELRDKIIKYVNSKVDTYQKIYEIIQPEENKLPLTNLNKVNRRQLQDLATTLYKESNNGGYQKKIHM